MGNTEAAISREALTGQVSTDRPRILVVDDNLAVGAMLHEALNLWGYEVALASNGQEGLDVLAKQDVEGILLDLKMPVMDGRTMLDEMRWLGKSTPVLVMSGGENAPNLRELTKEGAQGFLTKPFSLPALQKLCAKVFGNHGVAVSSSDHSQMG